MAGCVQIPPPTRWPPIQVSFAISHPSSVGFCGMVLNTHFTAPVLPSIAAINPPGMCLSERDSATYSMPLRYVGGPCIL